MKLASLKDLQPDGRLVVVASDHTRAVAAQGLAPSLIEALRRWDEVAPALRELSDRLNRGAVPQPLHSIQCSARYRCRAARNGWTPPPS